jgi:serine/threonine kinase 16
MDFGSTIKWVYSDLALTPRARIPIANRQQALLEQDIAAEHSTMPYRAPELFDVKTGKTLDEKVDIWSLGCTLYAVAYGFSPFETDGASIAMAVMSGRYRHPGGYSDRVTKLIDAMLVVDPAERPDIQKVGCVRVQPGIKLSHAPPHVSIGLRSHQVIDLTEASLRTGPNSN